MTRAEIAAEKVRKAQAKREDEQRKAKEKDATYAAKVRQAKTVEYHEAQKALTRRRHAVGDLAERAGLFAWSNAELSHGFLRCSPPCIGLAGLRRVLRPPVAGSGRRACS